MPLIGVVFLVTTCSGPEVQKLSDQNLVPTANPDRFSLTPNKGRVVQVLDSVTIEVESGGRTYVVRYLGVTLPDGVDAAAAFEFNAFLVKGKIVKLSTDTVDVDLDGALLRYVFADGEMVNLKLLSGGWGEVASFPPDFEEFDKFLKAESEARSAGQGIWSVKVPPIPVVPPPAQPPASIAKFVGGTLPARPGSLSGPASACDSYGSKTPVFKGNVEQPTGERLYHVPGGLFHSTTVVEPDQRDRLFYAEAEAQALVWMRSKR